MSATVEDHGAVHATSQQQVTADHSNGGIDDRFRDDLARYRLLDTTKRAEFYLSLDDTLVKRYVTHEARQMVERDRSSLQTIRQQMGNVRIDGWVYRIVDLHCVDVDRGVVVLEYASGSTLPELSRASAAEAEYHCGVWLALYHNVVFGPGPKGLVYTDFTVHNTLVDIDGKSIVAIDPGIFWGTSGYVYEDVQRHISSATHALLGRGQLPFAAVAAFLRGYGSATKRTLRLRHCYLGLIRELCREVRDFARVSWRKCVLFLILLVFALPFYVTLVPILFWWLARGKGKPSPSAETVVSDILRT